MLNALLLATMLGAAPVVASVPLAPNSVQPPALQWGLDGFVLWDFEGDTPVMGLIFTPDVEFPLGVVVQLSRVEWNETSTTYRVNFFEHRRPVAFPPQFSTVERDDVRFAIGVKWSFR